MNCQAPPSQAWKCHVNGSPPKADQDDIEAPRTAEVSPAIHFKLCIHAEDVVSFLIADSAPPRPGRAREGGAGRPDEESRSVTAANRAAAPGDVRADELRQLGQRPTCR